MHNALAHPRLHNPKNQVIGIYAPDGPPPPPTVPQGQDASKPSGRGASLSPDACVYVPTPKGQHFKSMGQADRKGVIWLLPEEALYLLERGSLDIRWPTAMTGGVTAEEGSDEELSIPMSLQAAYACFIGRGGLTLERFTVFSSLKRIGYAISRAAGWDDSAKVEGPADEDRHDGYTQPLKRGPGLAGILGTIFDWINDPKSTSSTAAGPVVGYGIHRNYSESQPLPTLQLSQNHTSNLSNRCSRYLQKTRPNPLVRPNPHPPTQPPRHNNPFPRNPPRLQTLHPHKKVRPPTTRLPHRSHQHPRANHRPNPGRAKRPPRKYTAGSPAGRENGAPDVHAFAAWVSECYFGGCRSRGDEFFEGCRCGVWEGEAV